MEAKGRGKEATIALNRSCMLPAIKRVQVFVRDVKSLYLAPKAIQPHIRKAPKRCGKWSFSSDFGTAECSHSPLSSLSPIPAPKRLPKKLSLPLIQAVTKGRDEVSPLLPWAKH